MRLFVGFKISNSFMDLDFILFRIDDVVVPLLFGMDLLNSRKSCLDFISSIEAQQKTKCGSSREIYREI